MINETSLDTVCAALTYALGVDAPQCAAAPNPVMTEYLDKVFGGEKAMKNSDNNLARLARRLSKTPEKAPRIYVACGTEDFLFEANNSFVKSFGKKLNIEYFTEPGAHTWDFWDKHIEKALEWFRLPEAENVW